MLIDFLVDVAALIETTVALEKVAVTPGEPAATDKCSAAYVWGSQIFHSPAGVVLGGDDADCFYRRAYEIRYRLDLCIPVSEREQSTASSNVTANEFYTDLDLIWCAITNAASDGTLFETISACEDIVVGALIVGTPQGARVSAEGTILVTYPCQPGS